MTDWFKALERDWYDHNIPSRILIGALAVAVCIAAAIILAGMATLVLG